MMPVINGYVYIPVSNFQLSADWYAENLGFNVVKKDPIYLELKTESGCRIIMIQNDMKINSQMNFSTGLQPAYGFIVSDVESLYQQFVDKGIKVGNLYDYQGKSFSFYDPDGNFIEVWS